jgi:hypothetical protein
MAMRWLRLSGKLTFLLKGKKGKQSGSFKKKKIAALRKMRELCQMGINRK